jgi:hypothetical protein
LRNKRPDLLDRGQACFIGNASEGFANVKRFAVAVADGIAVNALMLAILTAVRSNEVIGMTWDEIGDLNAKQWAIPAERMKKTHVEHVVPLSDAAVAILREQEATRSPKQPYVFPGARPGKPLSDAALAQTLRRLGGSEYTVHGFRSTFRDWAGDHGVEFEVAEACLAHTVGNKVTRAYLRTTMVARRRAAMAHGPRSSRARARRPRSCGSRGGGDRLPKIAVPWAVTGIFPSVAILAIFIAIQAARGWPSNVRQGMAADKARKPPAGFLKGLEERCLRR